MDKCDVKKDTGLNGYNDKSETKILRLIWNGTTYQMCLAEMVFDEHGSPVDHIILDINPACEKTFGFTRDQVINKRVTELFPYYAPKWIEKCGEAVRLGKNLTSVEHIYETGRCYEVQVFPLGSGDQFITMALDITKYNKEKIRIGNDITPDKIANEALTERVELLNALMDYNPSLIFLKDESGRYIYLNSTYEKQFVGSKNWYGKTDYDFWSKESAELFRANDLAVLESGQVTQYLEDSKDLSGTRYCWLNYKFPYTDSKNRKYTGGIGINITKRILAEEALRKAEEELQHYAEDLKIKEKEALELVDSFTEGSWIVDRLAGTFKCSEKWSKRIGIDLVPEKERLSYTHTLAHPEDTADGNSIEHCIETGLTRFELEYRVKTMDSGYIWTQNRGKIVYDANGKAVKVYATTIDITERKRAEEALRKSEERYMLVNSLTPIAIGLMRYPELTYEQVNVAFERMFELNSGEAIGKTPAEMGLSLDPEGRARMFSEVFKHGSSNAWELAYATRSGEKRFGSFCFNLVEIGGQRYMLGSGIDITERKQMEKTLRESEEKYRELFESIDQGFCIIEVLFDENQKPVDYRFLIVNPAFEEQTGIINGAGRRMREIAPLHEEHWFQIYGRIALTGEPERFENVAKELHRYYDVNAWRVGEPAQRRVAILFNDISEQKQTEEALRKSEAQLESDLKATKLLQNISTQMLYENDIQVLYEKIVDTAMQIMHSDFGSLQLLHRERGESGALKLMVHKGFTTQAAEFWDWVDYKDNTTCSQAMKNKSNVVVPDIEKWDNVQDAEDLAVYLQTGIHAVQSTPLVSRNGELLGMFSTHWKQPYMPTEREIDLIAILARQAADLVERKEIEELLKKSNEELERSNEMKDEFLSLISHEFRTPLTVIISAIQMLKTLSWNELSDKAKGYFNTIRQNSNRQLKLVNNILDIAKVNADSFEVHKKNTDIVQLTKNILESIGPYADRKKIRVSFSFDPAELIIGIDEEKYERILLNLLSNAIKYTPKEKSITVGLSKKIIKNKTMACIRVCDNGIGIPTDKKEHIFARFGQVDSSLSRQAEGTGIGLHLTRMFVEMLGGEIRIDSKLGKGSTFTVLLPAIKVKETLSETAAHETTDNRTIQLTEIEFSDIYLDK